MKTKTLFSLVIMCATYLAFNDVAIARERDSRHEVNLERLQRNKLAKLQYKNEAHIKRLPAGKAKAKKNYGLRKLDRADYGIMSRR